jgi:3-oxoacyl-[acyl-carrier protein] reductase
MRLQNKVAVITGSGSGFGEGIALRFAAEGAAVVINDLNEVGGQRVATAITAAGGKAFFHKADVAKDADVAALVRVAQERFGRLDIWVNNAGITHRAAPVETIDEATFDRIYAVNVKALFYSAKHAVPVFKQAGQGVFLNIASTAGVRPRPNLVWYNGTKGAAITITKSMAVELAPSKIRVNAINPVAGETPLLAEFMGGADTPEMRAKFTASIPIGRLSKPSDIANAALYLCSDEADFITGVCLEVDGGRCV